MTDESNTAPETDAASKAPIPPELIVTYKLVGDMAPLFAAKAKARLGFQAIAKNRTVKVKTKSGDTYDFEYATLDAVRAACDPALAEQGLDIWHLPCSGLEGRELHTFLTHSSGAYVEAVLLIPQVDNWQLFGSAITYAERYSYQALAGVLGEHDDDGNAADGNTITDSRPRDRSKPAPPPTKPRQEKPKEAPPVVVQTPPQQPAGSVQTNTAIAPADAAPPKSDPPPADQKPGLTPDQLKSLGLLFRAAPPAGPWGRGLIDQLLLGLFAKTHPELDSGDGAQLAKVLQLAARLQYTPESLLAFLPQFSTAQAPNAGAAITALNAELQAFGDPQ